MILKSFLGAGFDSDDHQQHGTLYTDNNDKNNHSIFLDQKAPPGFASNDFISSTQNSYDPLSSSIQRHFPDSSSGGGGGGLTGSFDRQTIGENLIRSRSAAPSFDGGFSMEPPPGLSRRETPLASNRSTTSTIGNDSYLESSMDRSHILQLGQRRPASTGVIGGNQSSSSSAVLHSLGLGGSGGGGSGAVRPAAKTLMDLIQEDFPPESPVDAGDLYGT